MTKKTNKKAVGDGVSSDEGIESVETGSEMEGSTMDSEDNECSEESGSVSESGSGDAEESEIEEETSSGSSSEEMKENTSLTVFIKGLSYDLTEYDLKSEMEKIGKISRVGIPMTNDQKRNKGFGYVEFAREEDVKKALKLNNTMFLGREVIVNMANPRADKQRHTIYISNIPFECDKKKLRQYFEEMGKVVGMSLPYDKENDRLRGYGFVDYAEKGDYEAVLKKKLVFEDSLIYQKPANKDRNGRQGNNKRMPDRGRPRDNNFKDRKFRGNDGDNFRGKDRNKKHELDAQNRSNKKIKFDSDDE